MMRMVSSVLCLILAAAPMAKAAPADDAVAKAHEFIDAFDKGDMKTAAATHEPDAAIIDEVPPHQWRGFQAWAADLMKDGAAKGLSDEAVILGKTVRAEADGDAAYAVFEATFRYKQKGAQMSEPAQMVFAFRKGADGWKIAGWAWSGGVPRAG